MVYAEKLAVAYKEQKMTKNFAKRLAKAP